jgi:glycosyltransferase involved in cell wall biosynthesis
MWTAEQGLGNMKKICLLSPGHIASNPRLVKEANSLVQAGYEVRVVAGDTTSFVRPLDASLLASVRWQCDRVGLGTRPVYIWRKLKQKLARIAFQVGARNITTAMWAHSPMAESLSQVARLPSADLYIAHCLAALPAAAIAAERNQAKLGFDAEDFHVGQLANIPEHKTEIEIRDYIERTILPRCDYLTAASPMIAAAYTERYRVKIESILNVFPLSEAPSKLRSSNQKTKSNKFSLYWFSQTIGRDRGLEAIVRAMAQMSSSVTLYLRGIPAAGYVSELMQIANRLGVGDRIHWLPSAPPAEMARLAAAYDIGLSVEPGKDKNNNLCLGNKIFTYLLAGLPIILSKTPAQEALSHQLAEASIVVDIHNPQAIARAIDSWLTNPAAFETSRAVACQLGQQIYNWDIEQYKFLDFVEKVLKC